MIYLKRKFHLGLLLMGLGLISSCNTTTHKNSFSLRGKLSNSNQEWIIAYILEPTKVNKLDSVMLDKKGNFNLDLKTDQSPELILLKVKNYPERITLLVNNNDVINVGGDALYLNKTYTATGNSGTITLNKLTQSLNKFMDDADSIYASYRMQVNDSNGIFLKQKTDSLLNDNYMQAYEYVRNFCLENKDNLAGIVGLYSRYGKNQILDYSIDFNVFKAVSDAVNTKYPNNVHAENLKEFVEEKYQVIKHEEEVENNLEAGHKAPDIIRPNPEGKQIESASFQGKYLVLAFWSATKESSWNMNAGLKKIAKKYNKKNVALLSVSQDNDKLEWVNTIAIDHLKWNHVLSNEQVANAYNLKGESRLFLIDKQGFILSKDLSTDSLEVFLNQLIK